MNPINLHPGYASDVLRSWQGERTPEPWRLIYPLFVSDRPNACEPIAAMPGQFRWGADRVVEALAEPVADGLRAVLLFGVLHEGRKDERGSAADASDTPVIQALAALRAAYPQLLLMTDVCLCAYTDHGHCGLFRGDGALDSRAAAERLGEVAAAYAAAGAHMVAPSDMMDGRVGAIRRALDRGGHSAVSIMSYAAKFASVFYGPFRDAAGSAPAFGDRRTYQLPPAARRLAWRAVMRDLDEGADFVMVKPGGPYLDIVREVRDRVQVPVAVYQVSGEYAMLHHAAAAGAFELRAAVEESLACLCRAGADALITYFAPQWLSWKKKGDG